MECTARFHCHNPDNLLGGLDLSADSAIDSLVDSGSRWNPNLVLVDPGQLHLLQAQLTFPLRALDALVFL